MKLQFKLMALVLVVCASNVQAYSINLNKKELIKASFKAALTKNNGKKALIVAVPAVALADGYKLYKAGKFDSAIAKTKQAAKNAGSWINNHKKTTASFAAAIAVAYYGYRDLGVGVQKDDMPSVARRLAAAPIQGLIRAFQNVLTIKKDSYIKQLRNAILAK